MPGELAGLKGGGGVSKEGGGVDGETGASRMGFVVVNGKTIDTFLGEREAEGAEHAGAVERDIMGAAVDLAGLRVVEQREEGRGAHPLGALRLKGVRLRGGGGTAGVQGAKIKEDGSFLEVDRVNRRA